MLLNLFNNAFYAVMQKKNEAEEVMNQQYLLRQKKLMVKLKFMFEIMVLAFHKKL